MTQTFQNGVPISLESTQNELAFPTGAITPFAGTATPTGTVNSVSAWLICNGASYGTAAYPTLFNAIGYTYGGSGTAFNVPDLRGRVPMGAGTGTGLNASGTAAPTGTALTARAAGQWGGEETHLLSSAEIPAHSHPVSDPTHNHGAIATAGAGGGNAVATWTVGGASGGNAANFGYTSYSATGLTVSNNTGGGGRHAVVPPFIVINYIIKT